MKINIQPYILSIVKVPPTQFYLFGMICYWYVGRVYAKVSGLSR